MDSKQLIAELEHELVSTLKLLELVPANKFTWQPHHKAMPLGALALHVATIPGRYLTFANEGSTTLDTLMYHAEPLSKEEIINGYHTSRQTAISLLTTAEALWKDKSWNLTKDGSPVFTLPLGLFTRLLVFNHLFHHRGQLSTYLRTLDVPMPSIYGPSADANPFL